MRYMSGLGLSILLASCATTTTNYYSQMVSSWQGTYYRGLVKRWGTPDNKITAPDGQTTVLVYKTESYRANTAAASPSIGVNMDSGKPVIVSQANTNNPSTNRGMKLDCTAIFVVNEQGIIVETKIQGSGCYANQDQAEQMRNPSAPQKPKQAR